MGRTGVLRTLGCRLNQAESDQILLALADRGIGTGGSAPDVVVVNTCAVTSEASSASRKLIRRSVREFPDATVVVTGCYAVAQSTDVAAMEGVDAVLPIKDGLAGRVAEYIGAGVPVPVLFPSPRRNLKVQTGCDERCTFCIVPRTRGTLHSTDRDEILSRARRLVDLGVRELTVTGVHLGKYGHDVGRPGALGSLLGDLAELTGLERIRLSSIEASQVDDVLLDMIATEPKLCRHIHIPLQTGDPNLWQVMRRPGTLDRLLEVVETARSRIQGVALTTDVMVAFPGEDDAAFSRTLQVVKAVGFEKLHVFRFSPRVGTPAADDPHQLDASIKQERSRTLRAVGADIRRRWLAAHHGQTVQVLVEKAVPAETTGTAGLSGYTDTYARVTFQGAASLVGRVVDVLVASTKKDYMEGVLVEGLPFLQDR
ncbi:MAG: MiaB/RimO family radical SAM methylthiotransferase [Gammaproteobacteria bacterium]|nr:MiaB/RimO family radical SAM methylthiotransferase [Gammaproteobacteria bacterium]